MSWLGRRAKGSSLSSYKYDEGLLSEYKTIIWCLDSIIAPVMHMDDILVTGNDRQKHLQNLEQVPRLLAVKGLQMQGGKCQFFMPKVDYIGDTINKDRMHPISEKVHIIHEAPAPQNITERHAYIALLNDYLEFLLDLDALFMLLKNILKKAAFIASTNM